MVVMHQKLLVELYDECGEMDVAKTSYAVTYDRRWKANRPIDVLTGSNKSEAYTTAPPVREPRYRKEMVAEFYPGSGIAQYNGPNDVIFFIIFRRKRKYVWGNSFYSPYIY